MISPSSKGLWEETKALYSPPLPSPTAADDEPDAAAALDHSEPLQDQPDIPEPAVALSPDTEIQDDATTVTDPVMSSRETESAEPSAVEDVSAVERHLIKNPRTLVSRLSASSFPDQPAEGARGIPATLENTRHLLESYAVSVEYDLIKKRERTSIPGLNATVENYRNVCLNHIASLAAMNGLPISQTLHFVQSIADEYAFNPVQQWIDSKPWDGVDRLKAMYATVIEAEGYPAALKEALLYRWLLSAVAAALMDKSFRTRGVLTFQGPQSRGKTSWVYSLVPIAELAYEVIKLDHHLDGSNKDSIVGAISHWIVEIGELDSSFKKDVSRLKGFLTATGDKIRRPYARVESEYPRRTVFCATVNEHNFLVDSTGNSRWWTIAIERLDFNHGIDMQQVFAQLAVDFRKGAQWWLTDAEEAQLEAYNCVHRSVSIMREQLMDYLDLDLIGNVDNPAMKASEVLKALGYDRPSNAQARECGTILRELLGKPKRIKGCDKWRIPERRTRYPAAQRPIENDDDDLY